MEPPKLFPSLTFFPSSVELLPLTEVHVLHPWKEGTRLGKESSAERAAWPQWERALVTEAHAAF